MENIDKSALKNEMNCGGKKHSSNYRQNSNGRNQNNGNRNTGGFKKTSNYVGAPYNFVPFQKKTVGVSEDVMKVHGDMNDELLIGEISYTFRAETPIFISDGAKNAEGTLDPYFFKTEKGQFAIPGSSMRGLIRSNAQILGVSYIGDDIDDYSIMYRNVAGGAERKRYNIVLGSKSIPIGDKGASIGILTHVKAGYISNENGKYYIYQTVVDQISEAFQEMNYYVLSERVIANNLNDYPYFDRHPNCLQHKLKDGFRKELDKRNNSHYIGTPNKDYKPGYHEVSYEVEGGRLISKLGEAGNYEHNGYLVGTGPMNQKKALYIIPEIDRSKDKLEIPKKDVNAFCIDFERKKNTLKRYNTLEFFNLPKSGEIKPVFYINLDGKIYFGFTPRLRLFYDKTIKDGLKQEYVEFDYAKSLFGTITEKGGYKSKVSFSDAIAYGEINNGKNGSVVMAEPKPTSYYDYIKQTNGDTTYNTPDFELRGIKQYWLRKNLMPDLYSGSNDKIKTPIRPLAEGNIFKGNVRFHNLTKAELGLLLWSIKLDENSWQNIGMAKAYGFGAISLQDISVKTINLSKAYSLEDELVLDPYENKNVESLITEYKNLISQSLNGKTIDKLLSVSTLMKMKDSMGLPKEDTIRYMDLGKKEYQARIRDKRALPSVDDVIQKNH